MSMRDSHSDTVVLWREVREDERLSRRQFIFPAGQRGPEVGAQWLCACNLPMDVDSKTAPDMGTFAFKVEYTDESDIYHLIAKSPLSTSNSQGPLFMAMHAEHCGGACNNRDGGPVAGYHVHTHPDKNASAQWKIYGNIQDHALHKIVPVNLPNYFLTVASRYGPTDKQQATLHREGAVVVWNAANVEARFRGTSYPGQWHEQTFIDGYQWHVDKMSDGTLFETPSMDDTDAEPPEQNKKRRRIS